MTKGGLNGNVRYIASTGTGVPPYPPTPPHPAPPSFSKQCRACLCEN